jgi:hypothetical protein
MKQEIAIQMKSGSAVEYPTDVLALKYAQDNYGLDKIVTTLLLKRGRQASLMQPKPGEFGLVESVPGIAAKSILFVGVAPLYKFRYEEIRDFSRRVFSTLASSAPNTKTITLTLHGANSGLDEQEAFASEIAGINDAIQSSDFPLSLREIVIIEADERRFDRLQNSFINLIPNGKISTAKLLQTKQQFEAVERLRIAGYTSSSKEHVFVAMPFKEEMDDIYHYGIQGAVKAAGFLCERADLSTFTGNVMEWVFNRIKTSKLVIADLTDANPNVYLEVGYAWGCGIPTVLLINNPENLKFDVKDQRCLPYKKIKDLEEALKNELIKLKEKGDI